MWTHSIDHHTITKHTSLTRNITIYNAAAHERIVSLRRSPHQTMREQTKRWPECLNSKQKQNIITRIYHSSAENHHTVEVVVRFHEAGKCAPQRALDSCLIRFHRPPAQTHRSRKHTHSFRSSRMICDVLLYRIMLTEKYTHSRICPNLYPNSGCTRSRKSPACSFVVVRAVVWQPTRRKTHRTFTRVVQQLPHYTTNHLIY